MSERCPKCGYCPTCGVGGTMSTSTGTGLPYFKIVTSTNEAALPPQDKPAQPSQIEAPKTREYLPEWVLEMFDRVGDIEEILKHLNIEGGDNESAE